MIANTRKKLHASAISSVMAMLFCGGFLLSGSEFVGFPWGPLAGAVCWVVLGLLVLKMRGKYSVRM